MNANEKIRYRITFEKCGVARFVGHLDLQTLFQRALKRAGLPVAYSQGFNPHMLISFAQPLPLGMESLCEMVDIEMAESVDTDELIARLNDTLPDGFVVKSAELLVTGMKRVAAAVYAATYIVKVNDEKITEDIDGVLEKLNNNENFAQMREKVISIEAENEEQPLLKMTLRAGGEKNLKPAVVVAAMCEIAGVTLTPATARYTRTEIILKN